MLLLRKSLLAIFLLTQVYLCLGESNITTDLTSSVLAQQKQLPQELSPNFLLTDINYDHKKQTLSYTVNAIDTTPEEINSSKIVDSVCYKPQLRDAVKQGLVVSFFFYDLNKSLLDSIVISDASCQTHFNERNKLIQQDIEKFNSTILPEKINDEFSITKLSYQSSIKTITADVSVDSKESKHHPVANDALLTFTCNHYYFKLMLDKNINIQYVPTTASSLFKETLITPNNCDAGTLDPLDSLLINEVKKMKLNLKALSTEQIEIVDIGYNSEKKQVWNKIIIKVPHITKNKLNPSLNIRAICATPSIRNIINQDVSYLYSYYDTKNQLLMALNINEGVCKKADQENNILIKKPNQ